MSESLQSVYYILVFVGMLFAFLKVGINKLSILVLLIFWEGLFQYIGNKTNTAIYDIYKIVVVLIAVGLSWSNISKFKLKNDRYINLLFFLFSASFWITYFLYGGNIITILSQYLYKYGLILFLYHYFKDIEINKPKGLYVGKILLTVLLIQVSLSVVKVLFIGIQANIDVYEPIVGSISAKGAGTAVVVPIMALIFYWTLKNRKFEKIDWCIALSFIIIAFASAKRQPIVFFPLILYLLFSYVQKGLRVSALVKFLPIVILLFIVGVKLNPSFNPDNKVWGRFDIGYITNYSSKYYFGTPDINEVLSGNYDLSFGRGGGFVYYFQPAKLNLNTLEELLWGKGIYEVDIGARGRFTSTGHSDYGIEHSGLMGEAGAMLYSFGYLGTILMFLLAITIIRTLHDKRLAAVIIFYYLWDFLFYYNQVVYSSQSAVILLFIVFYSNYWSYYNKREMALV